MILYDGWNKVIERRFIKMVKIRLWFVWKLIWILCLIW